MGISWKFNGWGGKFPPWNRDAAIARRILEIENANRCFDGEDFVLEGGSFHTDGDGTLLVTESCLLNKNRNPGLSKDQIEDKLCQYLGVTKIIWLPSGLLWDGDTDGHVDNFACFARVGLVLLAWCEEDRDYPGQHTACLRAQDILERERDARGRRLEVMRVPLPDKPLCYTAEEAAAITDNSRSPGERLAASYLNFYIANGAVIVPGFGCPSSDEAARVHIQKAFPERQVIQLQVGRQLALGGGNIHCITQQQPCS